MFSKWLSMSVTFFIVKREEKKKRRHSLLALNNKNNHKDERKNNFKNGIKLDRIKKKTILKFNG